MNKFFLLGNPRSGTSLFRLMLNAHPKIASPPECGFLQWWFSKYKDWSASNLNYESVASYVKDILQSKKIETWSLNEDELIRYILENRPDSYKNITELIYIYWALKNEKEIQAIVDKNNYYIHHLEDLNKIWPDAKYLFLVRDGRDVACSYLDIHKLQSNSPYKPQLSSDIIQIAKEWNDNNLRIEQHLQRIGNKRWLLVKYEDLVSDTEKVLIGVCAFIGAGFKKEMLRYYEANKINHDEPLSTLDWKKKTLEKPDVGNIGRYKKSLEEKDIEVFNENAICALSKFNYEL